MTLRSGLSQNQSSSEMSNIPKKDQGTTQENNENTNNSTKQSAHMKYNNRLSSNLQESTVRSTLANFSSLKTKDMIQ